MNSIPHPPSRSVPFTPLPQAAKARIRAPQPSQRAASPDRDQSLACATSTHSFAPAVSCTVSCLLFCAHWAPDRYGRSTMCTAAVRGNKTLLQQLLVVANGADVDARDPISRTTVLYAAIMLERVAVVTLLLTYGPESRWLITVNEHHSIGRHCQGTVGSRENS